MQIGNGLDLTKQYITGTMLCLAGKQLGNYSEVALGLQESWAPDFGYSDWGHLKHRLDIQAIFYYIRKSQIFWGKTADDATMKKSWNLSASLLSLLKGVRIMKKYVLFFLCLGLLILPQTALAAGKKGKPRTRATHKRVTHSSSRVQRGSRAQRRAQAIARRRAAEALRRAIAFDARLRAGVSLDIDKDSVVGENLEIRQAALDALNKRAGTVVVMDTHTGELLTVVNQQWAIRQSFKPCSTIKLVTGIAGLGEHVINQAGVIPGVVVMDKKSGEPFTLDSALARSSNQFFQQVGSRVGGEKFIEYARALGLGTPTGVNAPGEAIGRLPSGKGSPRVYSHADGVEASPLQLAVLVTAITGGGRKVTPQIRKPTAAPQADAQVNLPAENLRGMVPGMKGATLYGTARSVGSTLGIAGKTGTCISRGTWIGLFISVAPANDPKYAVVVITRGRDEGGARAAGIAGKVYKTLVGTPSSTAVAAQQTQNTAPKAANTAIQWLWTLPSWRDFRLGWRIICASPAFLFIDETTNFKYNSNIDYFNNYTKWEYLRNIRLAVAVTNVAAITL